MFTGVWTKTIFQHIEKATYIASLSEEKYHNFHCGYLADKRQKLIAQTCSKKIRKIELSVKHTSTVFIYIYIYIFDCMLTSIHNFVQNDDGKKSEVDCGDYWPAFYSLKSLIILRGKFLL